MSLVTNVKEWIKSMFKRPANHVDDDTRVELDASEGRMAGRLSRLTGKERDDVLAEAYRRADRLRSHWTPPPK